MRSLAFALCAIGASSMASADCPEPSSLERYVESTRDALVALQGTLPAEQYADLENRYAAMVLLEWDQIGLPAIADDYNAVSRLMTCFRDQACGSDGSDPLDAQLSALVVGNNFDPRSFSEILTDAPSNDMLVWAEIELGCREAPVIEPELEITLEPGLVSEPVEADTQLAASEPETEPASVTEQIEALETDIELTEVETEEESVDALATVPINENSPAFRLTSEEAQDLFEQAAARIASGEIENAIPPLRASCLYEASQSQSSMACDTLLDIYEVRTVHGREEIMTSNYLSFSEEVCGAGYIQGCQNMARYLRAANSDGAYERGVSFTAKACELGDADACATLASDHIDGRTERQDLTFARDTLQRSCNLGRLESCRDVADLYIRGVGGTPDNDLALNAIARACPAMDARSPDLCVAAADFVLINMKSSDERAMWVRSYVKRACDIGHGIGCAWYAEDLELGIGGTADPERAREARLVACEYGDQASCQPRS